MRTLHKGDIHNHYIHNLHLFPLFYYLASFLRPSNCTGDVLKLSEARLAEHAQLVSEAF